MLAVEDPHNDAALLPLSRLSGSLYAAFLAHVKALSGLPVPFQTEITRQMLPDGSVQVLAEKSLDPRQLAPALLAAVLSSGAQVLQASWEDAQAQECLQSTEQIVHTTGAWSAVGIPVTPRKGQILRVRIPQDLDLREVYRSEHVYVVPRTSGPQAGTALIGATVEDVGFDVSTSAKDLEGLRASGATLVPQLGNAEQAPTVEAWAGLRPATPDGLPVLGPLPPAHTRVQSALPGAKHFLATGHFRNGILLAPATAMVMADLLSRGQPAVDLTRFAASRFTPTCGG